MDTANRKFEDWMSSPVREEDALARRAVFAAQVKARTAIDEDMIRRLVHAFYGRVGADALLGPIFAERIADWELHLERMCAFWSSVTLMSGYYHGRPMRVHAALNIDGKHFQHWLALFAATACAVCPASAAERFIEKARSIAESLKLGIVRQRGPVLTASQRPPAEGAS
jgi:hemoglobin